MPVAFRGWRGVVLAVCAAVMMLSPAAGPSAKRGRRTAAAPVEPQLRSRHRGGRRQGRQAGVRHERHAALAADRAIASGTRIRRATAGASTMVDPVKKAKTPLFDHFEDGRGADVDHAEARTTHSICRSQYDQVRKNDSGLRVRRLRSRATPTSSPRRRRSRPRPRRTGPSRAAPTAIRSSRDSAAPGPAPPRGPAAQPDAALRIRHGVGQAHAQRRLRAPAPRPRWATLSPDEQTILFARNHNLYMMNAANWAKAQKNANDSSIVETKLTTDGEEFYSYARSRQQDQQIQEQQQQQQQDQQDRPRIRTSSRRTRRRRRTRTRACPR